MSADGLDAEGMVPVSRSVPLLPDDDGDHQEAPALAGPRSTASDAPARTALAVRHVAFEDLGIWEQVLRDRGYGIRYLDAGIDPIPRDGAPDADLLVVLGGPIGAADMALHPVLADELALLRERLARGLPVLGVCLGAQLLAVALGAAVTPTGRTEIGYGPLTLTAHGRSSVLAPLDGLPVLHWHGDEFAIPVDAEHLAATPGFSHQAFRYGARVLGLQFHLEADHRRIDRWLIGHAHELASVGIDPRDLRRDAAVHGPALEAAARAVLDAWLDGAVNSQLSAPTPPAPGR